MLREEPLEDQERANNLLLIPRYVEREGRMTADESRRINDALQRGYDSIRTWFETGCRWKDSTHENN